MSLLELDLDREINPVDMIEHVATANDWEFERSGEDEINIVVSGVWADYNVSFSWMEDFEALHLACAFDLKVPQRRMPETMKLLSMVNEQLLIGHFDLWMKEQLECLLVSALEACERYYQAFQFVVWAGRPARESLESALFETQGNA